MLSLNSLRELLGSLEAGDDQLMSDNQLIEALHRIHNGFTFNAPIYDSGLIVWRMVKVQSLPAHMSRLSYPPAELLTRPGRMNRVHEQVFYGSLGFILPCIFEVGMAIGDFYCASAWRSKEPIVCNHLGYSEEAVAGAVIPRRVPLWAQVENDTDRNSLIRKWQARIFTRTVPKGSESLYRLGLALKDFVSGRFTEIATQEQAKFHGTVYPSVASTLSFDNIALLPASLDKSFEFIEARLLAIITLTNGATVNAREFGEIKTMDYDCASAGAEGNLMWGAKRQFTFDDMLGMETTQTDEQKNFIPIRKQITFQA